MAAGQGGNDHGRGGALRHGLTHEDVVRLGAAAWGLALAIALIPAISTPAPPGQLPGYTRHINLDAHAPFRFIALLVLLPFAFAFASRPLARVMATARTWARNGVVIAMASALWIALVHADALAATLPVALFVAAFVALRNRDAEFSRRDAVLVPTFFALFIATVDLLPGRGLEVYVATAAAITLALRLYVRDPHRFALAPLALIFESPFFSFQQSHLGWPAIVWVVVSVLALRVRNVRRWRAILALVIYPIAAYTYAMDVRLASSEGKPRANLFEDAHSLMVANELLRGESMYRDALPAHGLIEDGGLDYVAMRLRGATYGSALKTRDTVANLTSVGIYAVTLAATGSPDAGILASTFAAILGTPNTVRAMPALFALACIVAAVRRRNPRYLIAAGILDVLTGLTSLDLAFYTLVALVFAIVRMRSKRALRDAAIGLGAAGTVLVIALATSGIFGSFLYGTFVEVPSFSAVYTIDIFEAPEALKTLRFPPEALAAFFDRGAWLYVLWVVVALATAVAVSRPARRRAEPLVVIGIWMVATAISYAERHHLYFGFVAPAMLIACTFALFRQRSRFAWPLAAILVVTAQLTAHFTVVSMVRQAHGPWSDDLVEMGLPRAKGALFAKSDVAMVDVVHRWTAANLAPNETFFDFTNRGTLYFLLDRDCPVRFVEVAFYETEERQREVIAALQRNPRVRAAIVPLPADNTGVDGIPNDQRAPIVWDYLSSHFEPAHEEGGVAIWKRKQPPLAAPHLLR